MVKKGELVAPATTPTVEGTPTLGSLLFRLTITPPAGAGPFSATLFDVVDAPPTTDVGDSVTEDNATGLTVRFAILVMPLYEAEIVTIFWAVTDDVVMGK